MRRLPASEGLTFLLDENVSNNLKKLLQLNNCDVITVQELNKRGLKNSKLLNLARKLDRILITYDKDFLYMKHDAKDRLILVDIHPLIDQKVIPAFRSILNELRIEDFKNHIVILYEETFKLRIKNQ